MKAKIVLITAFLLVGISGLQAQDSDNGNVVRENFEKNLFQWEDFFEKSCKGYIDVMENVYVLQNKNDFSALSVTRLPVDIDRNFKIKMRFQVSSVDKEKYFGIVYNYKDLSSQGESIGGRETIASFRTFRVAAGKFQIGNGYQYMLTSGRKLSKWSNCFNEVKGTLILRPGRDKEVELEIEKRGNQLIFFHRQYGSD